MGILLLASLSACPTPRDRGKSNTHVDLAIELAQKGDFTGAEREVVKAEQLDPRNERAWNVHGLVHLGNAAITTYNIEIAVCAAGAEADELRRRVDEEMRAAEGKLRRATDLAPDYGEAWKNRGAVAIHFGAWDDAIAFEKKALAHAVRFESPESEPIARANLSWAYHNKGEYVQATTELVETMQRSPGFCLGAYRLAAAYFKQERWDEAAEYAAKFAEGGICATQAPLEALQLGGQLQTKLGNPEDAAVWWKRCVEAAPQSCMAKKCGTALGMNP